MILDHIKNMDCYTAAHPLFAQAFAYLRDFAKNPEAPGSYDLVGDALVAKVQAYDTHETGKFEVHNRYIDIQYIVEGEEKLQYAPRAALQQIGDFNEESDYALLEDGAECVEFPLRAGEFAVFFPEDAHKPGLSALDTASPVKKIVMKVKI